MWGVGCVWGVCVHVECSMWAECGVGGVCVRSVVFVWSMVCVLSVYRVFCLCGACVWIVLSVVCVECGV